MTDLVAAVVTLEAQRAGELDVFQGRAMHALFLDLLGRADPYRADTLHHADAMKPFTVSNLIGLHALRAESGNRVKVAPGAVFYWRVTIFEPTLTALWLNDVLPKLPGAVRVGDLLFAVRGWTDDEAEDDRAGTSSYAELVRRYTLNALPPVSSIPLRFVSPTAFHSGGAHMPLPIPSMMLGHWLEKWNAFAPLALHPDVRSFAEREVLLSNHDLHTEEVNFGPATIIGFVGQCSLSVQHKDPYWRRIPHLLAAYSFWCGTGHKTPYGLGQTRPGR